ncbi:DUF2283 domain-containing protein, partial [Methylomagnum sp.]
MRYTLSLRRERLKKTEEIKPGLILDYDAHDNILGVEM